MLGNVGLELGHSLLPPPKKEAHGPHRSPEKTVHMIILMLIQNRKKPFFYYMIIEWFSI